MLKIKKDVDLKELEKYGFKLIQEDEEDKSQLAYYVDKNNVCGYGCNFGVLIVAKDRTLLVRDTIYWADMDDYYGDLLNPLYDMITDGIVIKVEE